MKRKRGFTLVELLAIIVILGIIALIATPMTLNVINSVQKGAAERSAGNYIKAIETTVSASLLSGEEIKDGLYTTDENGAIVKDDKSYSIDISGNVPEVGSTIFISDGKVVAGDELSGVTIIKISGYQVSYDGNNKLVATKK